MVCTSELDFILRFLAMAELKRASFCSFGLAESRDGSLIRLDNSFIRSLLEQFVVILGKLEMPLRHGICLQHVLSNHGTACHSIDDQLSIYSPNLFSPRRV